MGDFYYPALFGARWMTFCHLFGQAAADVTVPSQREATNELLCDSPRRDRLTMLVQKMELFNGQCQLLSKQVGARN